MSKAAAVVADPEDVGAPPGGLPPPFEGDDAPAGEPSEKGKGGAKAPDEMAQIRGELDRLKKENEALSSSERYWAERARGGKLPGDAEGDDGDEEPGPVIVGELEPEDPDAFLDELSKKGPAAIAAALEKRGYVKKQDVEKIAAEVAGRIVERKAAKMTADDQLVTQYPELKDEKSPLFQATGEIYRRMVAIDASLKKSPATLFMAAEQAKLKLELAKSRERPDPGDYREERGERRERIDAQMGQRGRDRGTPFEGDDDDRLGPEQREVISLFAKGGVDEDGYRDTRSRLRRR